MRQADAHPHRKAESLVVKILVLGGTRFLGRAVVERAAGAGIEVTCFRRGTAEPETQVGRLIRGDPTNARTPPT